MFAEKNSDEEKKETTGAVLVAISIPIFTSQLEKSREAVDAANIRAGYAEAMSAYLTSDKADGESNVYDVKQTQANWQTSIVGQQVFLVPPTDLTTTKKYKVTVKPGTNAGDEPVVAIEPVNN